MRAPRPRPLAAAFPLAAAILILAVPPIGSGATSISASREVRAAAPEDLPRVSFVASPGGTLLVHGTYPAVDSSCVEPIQPVLHTRHTGTIEVGRAPGGTLFVIGVLAFEDYVAGVAEVPRTWPMEALKAQVVAARTYALSRMQERDPTGSALGYQICATTACQVYRGTGVSLGPYGERWRAAIQATAGQALVHDGQPAKTFYFSTSNGQTFGNEEIFGGSPLPYLRPVVERDDGASPLSHWQVELPLEDVARFLRKAGLWSPEPVTSVSRVGSNVVVAGPNGARETIDVTEFRTHVNAWGPCLVPERYPPLDLNGTRLPLTVPSRWFSASSAGASVTFTGRGWGHGVGMVQWGAYGKASRGVAYGDILAAYYGGLRPEARPTPATIRVGIATGLASVRIEGAGDVTTFGREAGPGPWLVTGGTKLRITQGKPLPSYISGGTLQAAPSRSRVGTAIQATVDLPQLSVVGLVLRGEEGEIRISEPITRRPGAAMVEGRIPLDLLTGRYELHALVTDGTDIVRSNARVIHVTAPPGVPSAAPSPSPARSTGQVEPGSSGPPRAASEPAGSPGPSPLAVVLAAGAAVATASFVASTLLRRRKRRRATREQDGAWSG
jgi:stage II sporulation protein D